MTDLKVYDHHGVNYREQLTPDGWVVIDEYTPCHTVTPWDYYALLWYRPILRVLESAGIKAMVLETVKVILRPCGTGPKGAVRFGDNMMPGDYRIAVEEQHKSRAIVLIGRHNYAVKQWIDGKAPMPEQCRG